DYDFLDLSLNEYYRALNRTVRPWIHNQGLSNRMNYAWDEFETIRRLVPEVEGRKAYAADLRSLVQESNEQLFHLVEESSIAFEQGDRSPLDPSAVLEYCVNMEARLVHRRNQFIAENLPYLVDEVSPDCAHGPVMTPQVH